MRSYYIRNVEHKVYDDVSEVPKDLKYLKDWRKAELLDWVLADDGCVLQVLRKNYFKKKRKKLEWTLGTATGTFHALYSKRMDTEPRANRYSLSGNSVKDTIVDREKMTMNEEMFAYEVMKGVSPVDAYLKVYKTNDRENAYNRAMLLIKTKRIRKALKEELKPVMQALGIDPEMVLSGIRDIARDEDAKHSDRLKALFELGDILDLKENKQTTEVTGALFQGFQPDQLEASIRHQLKE